MRLLADENLPGPVVIALRSAGHDVAWIFEDARGNPDRAINARARAEDRLLITFDTDFGDMVFRDRVPSPPGIILLRLPATLAWTVMGAIVVVALNVQVEWQGNFAVVDERRIQLTRLPASPG